MSKTLRMPKTDAKPTGDDTPTVHPAEPSVVPPARVSADELLYLRRLLDEQSLAQSALERFRVHLSQRYQLGPTDRIDIASGTITRQSAPRPAGAQPV